MPGTPLSSRPALDVVFDALHRSNAAHPWDHNAHYHPWILRQLPDRFGRALDVGCGTGDLVRLPARRAGLLDGVAADPAAVGLACGLAGGVPTLEDGALSLVERRPPCGTGESVCAGPGWPPRRPDCSPYRP